VQPKGGVPDDEFVKIGSEELIHFLGAGLKQLKIIRQFFTIYGSVCLSQTLVVDWLHMFWLVRH
jgi:hypothetical protein